MMTTKSHTARSTGPKALSTCQAKVRTLIVKIEEATETDLPRLVDIQTEAFRDLAVERVFSDPNDPNSRQSILDSHLRHIKQNSDLKIAKAVLCRKAIDGSGDELIVGFCMFYLPNQIFDTPEGHIPTPVRSLTSPVDMSFIADPVRRKLAESLATASNASKQANVNGRVCGYVRYMAVDPLYQRRGIGQKLMEWGCRRFDEAGVDAYLQASHEGQGLYMYHGFEPFGAPFVADFGDGRMFRYAGMWRNARNSQKVEE